MTVASSPFAPRPDAGSQSLALCTTGHQL